VDGGVCVAWFLVLVMGVCCLACVACCGIMQLACCMFGLGVCVCRDGSCVVLQLDVVLRGGGGVVCEGC
jgi:hypothetical protein